MRVEIKAKAGKAHFGDDYKELTDLSILNNIDCQDNFADYADDEFVDKLEHGYMYFSYELEKDGKGTLYTITDYKVSKPLTREELIKLGDYTQGQWSDGIGEGFEQNPCTYTDNDEEVYVSPWYRGQKLEIRQRYTQRERVLPDLDESNEITIIE